MKTWPRAALSELEREGPFMLIVQKHTLSQLRLANAFASLRNPLP